MADPRLTVVKMLMKMDRKQKQVATGLLISISMEMVALLRAKVFPKTISYRFLWKKYEMYL